MKVFSNPHREIPNAVSVLRALLGILIPFFLFPPQPFFHWMGLALFVGAAITDYIDGYLARSFSWESSLGKILDPTADKILILASLATFAYLDLLSMWWLAPIFVREIVITFCRIGWSLEGTTVGAEKVGKLKFGSQVAAVILAYLYYFSFSHPKIEAFRYPLNYLLMGSLLIATFLTLYSGLTFVMNNKHNFQRPGFMKYCAAAGVGLIPLMPGTWGSLIGLILGGTAQIHPLFFWGLFLLLIWMGFWAVGSLDLKKDHDPHYVVMDEVLGMMVALYAIPLHALSLLTGFILFRLFDIAKPFPLRQLERLPGFWGILADDLGAGVYTWFCLFVLFRMLS